jgi:hypothetical protein
MCYRDFKSHICFIVIGTDTPPLRTHVYGQCSETPSCYLFFQIQNKHKSYMCVYISLRADFVIKKLEGIHKRGNPFYYPLQISGHQISQTNFDISKVTTNISLWTVTSIRIPCLTQLGHTLKPNS